MNSILKDVLRVKKEEIFLAKTKNTFTELQKNAEKKYKNYISKDFTNNLKKKISFGTPAVIAEIKKFSPIKGKIRNYFNPCEIAINYFKYGATCLSVITDNFFFKGSYNNLIEVRKCCNLPILCKDFVIDIYQIYYMYLCGADAILLISSLLNNKQMLEFEDCANSLGMDVIVEIHNFEEIENACMLKTSLLGINNRDLNTFKVSLKNTINLSKYIPKDKIIISESGFSSLEEIEYIRNFDINIFLVGEIFMKSLNPGLKLFEMFYKKK